MRGIVGGVETASVSPVPRIRQADGFGVSDPTPGLPSTLSAALSYPAPESRDHGLLRHMPELDSLRALAVTCVLIQHFLFDSLRNYFPYGRFGVRLFFVLSGFLITGILLRCRSMTKVGTESRPFALRRFYTRRFLRLFPPYYMLLFVAALLNLPAIRQTFWWHASYLSNILFAKQGSYGEGPAVPFWSLAVEEQFYLVWPWLVLFARRSWLLPLFVLTVAMGPAYRLFAVLKGWSHTATVLPTPACFDTLAIGALLGLFSSSYGPKGPWRERLCQIGLWIGVPAALASSALFYKRRYMTSVEILMDTAMGLMSVWIVGRAAAGFAAKSNDSAVAPSTGLLPQGMRESVESFFDVGRTIASRVLRLQTLRYIGKISYGIYLYHMFCPYIMQPIFNWLGMPLAVIDPNKGNTLVPHPYLYFTVMSGSAVVLAMVSWHLFERPIAKLKDLAPYERRKTSSPSGGSDLPDAVPAPIA